MKIINYLISIVILVLATACQEDWLEPKPLSIFTPENVYVNKKGLDGVLLSLRKDLRSEYYSTGLSTYIGEYISSDYGVRAEESTQATHDFNFQVTPTGT